MPCYDPDTHERPIRLEAKVHKLTAMLCGLCARAPGAIVADPQLAEWWRKHQEHDTLIIQLKTKQIEHGENSLTPQELGILTFAADVSYEDGDVSVHIINP